MQIIQSDGKTAITYPYKPSGIAAWIFVVIFGLGTLVHIVQMFRLRTAYFIPFLIGCICETFGYYGRVWSHQEASNVKPYVMQYLLILPAPIFLVASIFMSLSRIVQKLDAKEYSPIGPRWLAKLFVLYDVMCFIIQMAGAGMESTTSVTVANTGSKVIMAGIVLQCLVTIYFVSVTRRFQVRARQNVQLVSAAGQRRWTMTFLAFYFSSGLLLVRNIVRVAQEAEGFYGFVNSHEIFAYLFEAVPMALIVWTLILIHPGALTKAYLQAQKRFQMDDTTPMVGVGKER